MYSTDFCRLRLASEKEEIILKYIKERRYTFMLGFYISLAVSVLGFVPALLDLRMAMNGDTLLSLPEMDVPMLAAGILRRRGRYYAGELFFGWCAFVLLALILFIQGIGKIFGPGSDYHCFIKQKYAFGTMRVSGKAPDTGKHPYYVYDQHGDPCICPVFLDYRNVNIGDEMFCVLLDNGKRYVLMEKQDM